MPKLKGGAAQPPRLQGGSSFSGGPIAKLAGGGGLKEEKIPAGKIPNANVVGIATLISFPGRNALELISLMLAMFIWEAYSSVASDCLCLDGYRIIETALSSYKFVLMSSDIISNHLVNKGEYLQLKVK